MRLGAGQVVALIGLGLTGCRSAPEGAGPDEPAGPPAVVFIMADDLGYGDLGCYGQEVIRTPRIDELAAEGLRFRDYYAGSTVCAPSRCCLMTGYHTGRARIRGNSRDPLLPEDVTVAEVLQGAGYSTALVGKWGLGEEGSTGIPTRQGFDEFFGYLNQRHAHNYYPEFLWRGEDKVLLGNVVEDKGRLGGVALERVDYSHDLFAEEALQFIRRRAGSPFFLYLSYTIPHANNEAGDAGMEVPDLGPYAETDWPAPQKGHAAMITRLDRDVGRLLDLLDELGIADHTWVFFTSDNGPHGEGGADPQFFHSSGPLRGIKRDLLEGGVRVPMIVRGPGVPAGATSTVPWAHWDVLPTLAELAGVPSPTGIDGISMVPALRGEEQSHPPLYWAFYEQGGAQALRAGPWKAVARPADGPLQLYHLERDPGEATDLAAQLPEQAALMREAMQSAYVPSPLWRFPHEKRGDGDGRP